MRRHLFWLLVAVAAGVAAHSAFALFVPGWWFSREVRQLAHAHGKNSFFILSPAEQARLFPGLPRFGVTGLCVFDVASGDVTFAAQLPDGFWIATIYTEKAEAIYSVNNRQSGANSFAVSLSRAPGFIEQILKSTEKEAIDGIDSGWTVTSPEPRGLAVVWYPTPEIGLRELAAEQVARSRCTVGLAGGS
ncbi:MAG: hypothetical protein IOC82_10845 [Aestuariivirga sp.]|uniref:hypothetical protein n=1 Tax=Aestuariivirga sp. TaxID=2650926 RepID=UPI0025BA07CE|nr:hypothetical protein [Aestuariivirga sp.]MCA3561511.1 hypothetical protein [Aestuariivirga sp.]